jgi:hypothetical protein
MSIQAALSIAVFAVFAGAPALAQQPVETAEPSVTATEDALAKAAAAESAAPPATTVVAKSEPAAAVQQVDGDALLRAQAAGYKLVNKDGRELFCKKEMVTGSRLATRTRCLTLAQLEEQRNATKDMLMDMNRRSVNRPEEGGN